MKNNKISFWCAVVLCCGVVATAGAYQEFIEDEIIAVNGLRMYRYVLDTVMRKAPEGCLEKVKDGEYLLVDSQQCEDTKGLFEILRDLSNEARGKDLTALEKQVGMVVVNKIREISIMGEKIHKLFFIRYDLRKEIVAAFF